MSLVALRNVSKTYRRGGLLGRREPVRAVRGASLEIAPGSCLALVGPSGSGKSTLGRLLLGLERPDGGEVLYRGRNLRSLRGGDAAEARRNLQVVFQNSQGAVNPRFTAARILGEPLVNFDGLRGSALRERAAGLLERVGLDGGDLDKLPHQFSGGELQRVCLARALASRPALIVLDEAVSALDTLNQSRVLAILAQAKREQGTAFLFITHDLRVVANIADSLAIMERGEVAAYVADLDALQRDDVDARTPLFGRLVGAVLPERPSGVAEESQKAIDTMHEN